MSRPGIYTPVSCPVNLKVKIFFAENKGFYSKGSTGFPGGRPVRLSHASGTKMAETLTFLREFRSLEAGPGTRWAAQDPGRWGLGIFWEFSGVFKEFRGVSILKLRTGRRAPSRDLSTGYPQLSLY